MAYEQPTTRADMSYCDGPVKTGKHLCARCRKVAAKL